MLGFLSSKKPQPVAAAAPLSLAESAKMEVNNETKKAIQTENDNRDIPFNEWGDYAKNKPKWLEQRDDDGYTPLHLASGMKEISFKDFETILNLYPGAAKIRARDGGEIPLISAANNPHDIRKAEMLLKVFPGGIYVKDARGKTAYDILNARKHVIENTFKSGNKTPSFLNSRLDFNGVYPLLEPLLKPPVQATGGSRKRKTRRNKKNRKSRKSRKYKN